MYGHAQGSDWQKATAQRRPQKLQAHPWFAALQKAGKRVGRSSLWPLTPGGFSALREEQHRPPWASSPFTASTELLLIQLTGLKICLDPTPTGDGGQQGNTGGALAMLWREGGSRGFQKDLEGGRGLLAASREPGKGALLRRRPRPNPVPVTPGLGPTSAGARAVARAFCWGDQQTGHVFMAGFVLLLRAG